MNSEIPDFYRTKTVLSLSERREAVYAAIRGNDSILLEKAIQGLSTDENDWTGEAYPTVFALNEMSSTEIITSLVENGFSFPDSPELLCFHGTPEEVVSAMMQIEGIGREEALEELAVAVNYYLKVIKLGYSCYRIPFKIYPDDEYRPSFLAYIDDWLCRYAVLLEAEKASLLAGRIVSIPELSNSWKLYYSKFYNEIYDRYGWIINKAIENDNEHAFLMLLDETRLDAIESYPRRSTSILDKLFSLGVLIPGRDKAYEAFADYVLYGGEVGDEHEEMLRRLMHPSYAERRDENGQTILMRLTGSNPDFWGYLYPVIAYSKETLALRDNDGKTALYYLAASRYPYNMESLIKMGASPYNVDGKGNTVLHVIIKKKQRAVCLADFEDLMEFLPKDLVYVKNDEGKTPVDIFKELLEK